SDKAVNPMCVMGVTKRAAELVVRDAAMRYNQPFVVVRFGNVLGSRGSVVPIFKNQIRNGGPVTITDPDVSRFFMTIPEAVRLVLQAGALGSGGETFVLDMGEPVKIVDLARDLIRLSGLKEEQDIDIKFTGLIEGEKMHEELFYDHEHAVRSKHEKIFVCTNKNSENLKAVGGDAAAESNAIEHKIQLSREQEKERETFKFNIDHLLKAARAGDAEHANELLKKIIPQYNNPALDHPKSTIPVLFEPMKSGVSAVHQSISENRGLLTFPKANHEADFLKVGDNG
ncbi:MAG TPA: polysaccharide biosynthesis protein, partial [Nitrosomonas sp.]|nr:polysaccharide biosynthesis protein [Nitrosomonas sp.]